MEWHSDGGKGEFTMLLGLEDVNADMGALRMVPRSHLNYVEGVGHDEVSAYIFQDNLVFFLIFVFDSASIGYNCRTVGKAGDREGRLLLPSLSAGAL
jgi:hypothetical protein